MLVAAELCLLRPYGFFLIFVIELVNVHVACNVGRLPSLKVERSHAVIERIKPRGLEQTVVEGVLNHVDHVVHLSDVSRSYKARNPITEANNRKAHDSTG